jgi:hypothetical protein
VFSVAKKAVLGLLVRSVWWKSELANERSRAMIISEKSDIVYRMIFVRAWANSLGIQSQALRELGIQAEKLKRMCGKWDHYFLFRYDSAKRARRMQVRNDRQIKPQYQRVLSLVEMVAEEAAQKTGAGVLNRAQVREGLYGAGGLIPEAGAYARKHCVK